MKLCDSVVSELYCNSPHTLNTRAVDRSRVRERPAKEVTMQESTSTLPFLQPIDEKRIITILATVAEMDRQILACRVSRQIPRTAHLLTDVQAFVHEKLGELNQIDRGWLVRFLLEEYPGLFDLAGLNDALAAIERIERVKPVAVII